MEKVSIGNRSLGVTFNKEGKAEINVWAPIVDNVALIIKGKSQISLQKDEFGYWKATTDQLKPHDWYKYKLNNDKELPDPASVSQPEGVHGYSEAIDLKGFSWTDNTQNNSWKNLAQENYIIYELHTGTFSSQGNFEGLEEKLDHLKDLGINAIELLPVSQFPGSRNWGYDGVYPFAVQHSYGGPQALQRLVNTCHEKGLAVILDVVYNHFGPEGNYLGEFGPYFTEKYNTPWGQALNFDDAWCDGVRKYFIENVLMWFRDFHIDALRMDAVHAIKDLSPNHILKEIKQNVNKLTELTGKRYYLIAEVDLNDTKFIDPIEEKGYGLDGQWIDEFHHALRVAAGNTKTGYYSEFDGIKHLAKSYKDAYVYDGVYSEHRKKVFGTKVGNNPGKQFVVFSQNHDQVGNRMLGERTSHLVSFEAQKLLAGAVMVSPYLPMLFMGEEWSASSPFQYFVSHTDPDLVEAVRKGRKAEFDFNTGEEPPDAQSEDTFQASKLHWDEIAAEPHQVMLNFYRALIALRKQNSVLKHLNRKQLDVKFDEGAQTLFLHRWYDKDQLYCLMNFSQEKQQASLPDFEPIWHKRFDSADPQWNGSGASPAKLSGGAEIQLFPESFLIYSNHE